MSSMEPMFEIAEDAPPPVNIISRTSCLSGSTLNTPTQIPIATNASSAPARPNLLVIPSELRRMIFSMLLKSDSNIFISRCGVIYLNSHGKNNQGPTSHEELLKPLLVCHQLYRELSQMFYTENTFEFVDGYHEALRFLEGIGPRRRALMSGVSLTEPSLASEVYWDYWFEEERDTGCKKGTRVDDAANRVYSLLAESRCLQKIQIYANEVEFESVSAQQEWECELGQWPFRSLTAQKIALNPEALKRMMASIGSRARVRDLSRELTGLVTLQELRGLKEVIVQDANFQNITTSGDVLPDQLLRQNRHFAAELSALLRQPKPLAEGEDERNLPAAKIRWKSKHDIVLEKVSDVAKDGVEDEDGKIKLEESGVIDGSKRHKEDSSSQSTACPQPTTPSKSTAGRDTELKTPRLAELRYGDHTLLSPSTYEKHRKRRPTNQSRFSVHCAARLTAPFDFIHAPNRDWPSPSVVLRRPMKTSNLLSIPKELRLRIFSYLLKSDSSIVVKEYSTRQSPPSLSFEKRAFTHQRDPDCPLVPYYDEDGKYEVYHWDLLRPLLVCQLLHDELMPYFYTENFFEMHHGYSSAITFLKGIGPRRRRLISHVSLTEPSAKTDGYSIKKTDADAELVYSLLGQSCQLHTLQINAVEIRFEEFYGYRDAVKDTVISHPLIMARENPKEDDCKNNYEADMTPYSGIKDLRKELPGIASLQTLRGLKEVIVRDANFRGAHDQD
ncbi:MAG: hypothetical protein Q9187_005148, partial [Circinaria calcarea]